MLFGIFQKLKYCATHIKPVTLKQKRSRTVERQIQKASHRGSLQKPYEDMKMTKKTRNKNGLESDRILLETIKEYPGLSQYELAKKLKWQSGRVDGAIRRLLNEGQVVIKTLERNGRRVNLVYPEDSKPANVVVVPEALLHVGNPTWLDSAFIYALDSTTIGVSGHEMPEWAEISCFLKKIPIERDNGKVVLEIPENFKRFYNIDKKHRVVTINGNNLLITISGNLIEEKKYPS